VEYFHSKGAKVVFGDLNDTNGKAIAERLGEYIPVCIRLRKGVQHIRIVM